MNIGSTWRKWDLHVHSPASIVHHYPGGDPWPDFLSDLAALPPELSVIGINDYLFIDGYRRVKEAHEAGQLPKIEAIFPVVELRLSHLVGTTGHLSKINFHVLFEAGIDPDVIEAQFINGLSAAFQLDEERPGVAWAGFVSRTNLTNLGEQIRKTIPPERRHEFKESDLELGFSNLAIPREKIREALDTSLFRNRTLTAIGKTEWASFPWGEGSIAVKKDLINTADLAFVAAETPAAHASAQSALAKAGVRAKLLDCSDAHCLSTTQDKDRVGNCFTWISADPTLDGLSHALQEYDSRVFVGDEPLKRIAVRQRPSNHIKRVCIRKTAEAEKEPHHFFDADIPLNPSFVAIVGNKGKGKSALLDAIGLAGATSNSDEFTFLSKERFRNPKNNMALAYEVTVTWCGGTLHSRRLDEVVDPGSVEHLTYLPQRSIDAICAVDPGPPSERFAQELGHVLFAHVPLEDRLGAADLESLIQLRRETLDERLAVLRAELSSLNESIASLERKGRADRKKALEAERSDLKKKLKELDDAAPPKPVPPETDDPTIIEARQKIASEKEKREELNSRTSELEAQLVTLSKEIDGATQLLTALSTLEGQVETFVTSHKDRAEALGVDIGALASLTVNRKPVEDFLAEREKQRTDCLTTLRSDAPTSVPTLLKSVEAGIAELEAVLDAPAREFEAQQRRYQQWNDARTDLIEGTPEERGIKEVEALLKDWEDVPQELLRLREVRMELVMRIHDALLEAVKIFRDLYRPALEFIESHPLASKASLAFGATLREKSLDQRFWDIVGRNVGGSFFGIDEGAQRLADLIEETDFGDPAGVEAFLDKIDNALHEDVRMMPPTPVDIGRAIRTGHSVEELYDLVFGLTYLEPYYQLQYSGTSIDQLSPGEKGTLLLMFYLLVDPNTRPLLLDQPDENLDNQTIYDLLVPALKEAKQRRQVIVITHNPNVAVVADADQVIVADFDGEQFSYRAGAIENPTVNEALLDILEGTRPAFLNRERKYQDQH